MTRELDAIFRPRSVCVVGASRDPESFGQLVVKSLQVGGFKGSIHPVNPHADRILGLDCVKSADQLPKGIDLAVVVVPSPEVVKVAKRLAAREVKAMIVITAGFRESGPEGEELEKKLTRTVRESGMRMIGPNCMGVINSHPGSSMNATFAPARLEPGDTAFLSQSGAMGVAILNYVREMGLSISMFASIGNRADVSANDLLEYWSEDPETKVILLYMESFGNPRRFTQIARAITPRKPIVAVKAGRTASGLVAADEHTGETAEPSAVTGADHAADALFEQCGVLRVDTLEELFDVARALTAQPLPRGGQVAVLTNGGGPGIMAADALEGVGLEVPPLDPRTISELRVKLSPRAGVKNPVDMGADADPALYEQAARLLLKDPNVDSMVVIYVGFEGTKAARAIAAGVAGADKPVLSCLMGGGRDDPGRDVLTRAGIPVYAFPESACRALGQMHRYKRFKGRRQGRVKRFRSIDRSKVRKIIEHARKEGRTDLTLSELRVVAGLYGAKLTREGVASSEDEAVRIAEDIGYPVAVKVKSDRVPKKSDLGGVALDIRTESELRKAYHNVVNNVTARYPGAEIEGVIIQEMLKGGHELILGSDYDPIFGPVLKLGAGGPYADLIRDFQFRIVPITPREAMEMIEALKIFPVLEGSRGRRPIHLPSLVDILCRSSQLVTDFEEVREFEINPLIVFPRRKEFWAVDGKMRLFEDDRKRRSSR